MSGGLAEQMRALIYLFGLYVKCGERGSKVIKLPADPDEARQVYASLQGQYRLTVAAIEAARFRLCATGLKVPDWWLAVIAASMPRLKQVSDPMILFLKWEKEGRVPHGSCVYMGLDYTDLYRLLVVCEEIESTLFEMGFEAVLSAEANEKAGQSKTPQSNADVAEKAQVVAASERADARQPNEGEWTEPMNQSRMMQRIGVNMDPRTFRKWMKKRYGLLRISRQLYQARIDKMEPNLRARLQRTAGQQDQAHDAAGDDRAI